MFREYTMSSGIGRFIMNIAYATINQRERERNKKIHNY